MRNLLSHDFVHIKFYKLENQSKIDQKKNPVENIRYNYTICDSAGLEVENGKCFGRVLYSFLKCLLTATTRDRTVG